MGTAGRVRAAEFCRATEDNAWKSSVSVDAYNRRASCGGNRTVALCCADVRLSGLQACSASSQLSRRTQLLSVGVEEAIFNEKINTRGGIQLKMKSSARLLVSNKDRAPMLQFTRVEVLLLKVITQTGTSGDVEM